MVDLLLDLVADDPEQNLPYWAEIWPSGVALADLILATGMLAPATTAIELGCGVGVTAIAALRTGVALTVTDYFPEALTICTRNCQANGAAIPLAAALNWRDRGSVLLALGNRRFDAVLAADVLYERRDVDPLLELVPSLLRDGGSLWLAEPGRPPAAAFLAEAVAAGWERETLTHGGPWPDPADADVEVRVHRLRPPAAVEA